MGKERDRLRRRRSDGGGVRVGDPPGAVTADERTFIGRMGSKPMLAERHVRDDSEPGAYKLLMFASHDLPRPHGRHEILRAIDDRGPWPLLDIRWLGSPHAASVFPGTTQLVARPLRVA